MSLMCSKITDGMMAWATMYVCWDQDMNNTTERDSQRHTQQRLRTSPSWLNFNAHCTMIHDISSARIQVSTTAYIIFPQLKAFERLDLYSQLVKSIWLQGFPAGLNLLMWWFEPLHRAYSCPCPWLGSLTLSSNYRCRLDMLTWQI
jgi:hypothetical protein